MRVVLVRHGEAEPHAEGGDVARRLTAAGRDRAATVGRWLRAQGVRPVRVVASPARRAQETAQGILAAWHPAPALGIEAGLYEADVADVARLARGHAASGEVVLVGHNPAFAAAVAAAADGPIARFAPGSAAILEIDEDAGWRLVALDLAP